jgi:hypothetical protein
LAFAASFIGSICAAETKTNSLVRDLGGGQLQIGLVTIDPKQKAVSFPASINMTSGVVEYLVVTTEGKVHESLLATRAEPTHIHTAMLLIGMTNSTKQKQPRSSIRRANCLARVSMLTFQAPACRTRKCRFKHS